MALLIESILLGVTFSWTAHKGMAMRIEIRSMFVLIKGSCAC